MYQTTVSSRTSKLIIIFTESTNEDRRVKFSNIKEIFRSLKFKIHLSKSSVPMFKRANRFANSKLFATFVNMEIVSLYKIIVQITCSTLYSHCSSKLNSKSWSPAGDSNEHCPVLSNAPGPLVLSTAQDLLFSTTEHLFQRPTVIHYSVEPRDPESSLRCRNGTSTDPLYPGGETRDA